MRTIEEFAELAIDSLSDLMDDRYFDLLLEKTPMEQVMHQYLHGDCDLFKDAMHEITGWSTVHVIHPKTGPYHRAVMSPDGMIVDIRGYVTPEDACRYNNEKKPRMSLSIQDGNLVRSADEDQILELCELMKLLPWAPFNEDWFIKKRDELISSYSDEQVDHGMSHN